MDQNPHNRRSPARSVAGEDEGSPHEDSLPACLSCRRRKSRCSRERPSCAQCFKIGTYFESCFSLSSVRYLLMNATIGAECQYVVKQKPGIKAGAVDNLNRRLGRAIFF